MYKHSIMFLFIVMINACSLSKMQNENNNDIVNNKFNEENILKVYLGMNSQEILSIFGYPNKITTTIGGKKTNEPWQCIVWQYNNSSYFYFRQKENSLILHNFSIATLNN